MDLFKKAMRNPNRSLIAYRFIPQATKAQAAATTTTTETHNHQHLHQHHHHHYSCFFGKMKNRKSRATTNKICRYSFHSSSILFFDFDAANGTAFVSLKPNLQQRDRILSQSTPNITKMDDLLSIIDNQHPAQPRSSVSSELPGFPSSSLSLTANNQRSRSESDQNSSNSNKQRKCCRKGWFEGNRKQISAAFRKLRNHLSANINDNNTNNNNIPKISIINQENARKESIIDQLRRRSTYRKLPKAEQAREWEESIEKLLSSPYGIELFHSFLKTEFSEETLEFWLACEDFKTCDKSEQKKIAHKICGTYVKVGAPKQINLDADTRNATMSRLETLDNDMFDVAQARVQHLMDQGPYPRFLESEMCLNLSRQTKSDQKTY